MELYGLMGDISACTLQFTGFVLAVFLNQKLEPLMVGTVAGMRPRWSLRPPSFVIPNIGVLEIFLGTFCKRAGEGGSVTRQTWKGVAFNI